MPMQTIACIFISKIKPQFVAVELFQMEIFFKIRMTVNLL